MHHLAHVLEKDILYNRYGKLLLSAQFQPLFQFSGKPFQPLFFQKVLCFKNAESIGNGRSFTKKRHFAPDERNTALLQEPHADILFSSPEALQIPD